ncbi:MAG: hypothetical protein ITG02_15935 [Patulibacter sp.]|nr:hypothetical protein [Patulibacter sp.]
MSDKAPTRFDRVLLRCVSGTFGHLVGTVLEVVRIIRIQRRMRRDERRSASR